MGKYNEFDIRMKNYENVSKNYLNKKEPVIIRIDMKAGHSFTKGLTKPFDSIFSITMQDTLITLCNNIQGCKFGYTQSDEISLLLTDFDNEDTAGWFDYNINKLISVSASMATLYFNKNFQDNVEEYLFYASKEYNIRDLIEKEKILNSKINTALFDSRAFNLPIDEVTNYFIWRQNDGMRNSIQSFARSFYSTKQMQNLSCKELIEKIIIEKDIDWNNLAESLKYGASCKRKSNLSGRMKFKIYNDTPIFSKNREYIEEIFKDNDIRNKIENNLFI